MRRSLDFARSGSVTTSLPAPHAIFTDSFPRAPATVLLRRNSSAASAVPWPGPGSSGPVLAAATLDEPRHLSAAPASGAAWHSRPPPSQMPSAGYTPLMASTCFAAGVPAAGAAALTAAQPGPAASPFAAAQAQMAPVASSGSSDSEEDAYGMPKRAAQWPMRRPLRRSSAGPAALDKMRNAARSRLLCNLRNRSNTSLRRRPSRCSSGASAPSSGLAPAAAGLDVLQNLDICAAVEQFRAAVA